MPSNGPHSFLLESRDQITGLHVRVNSLKRATLISTEDDFGHLLNKDCVNALKRATLISTRSSFGNWHYNPCVNALKRATLISTVPLQSSLFYKASLTPFLQVIHRIF